MASNIVDLNNNIIINAEFSIEFFDFRNFTLVDGNFSMMNNNEWTYFLNSTNTFNLPIISISSFVKNLKIWYRDTSLFDKMTVNLDSSKENNLLEFIARDAKYKDVILDDLKFVGAVVRMKYLDSGAQDVTRNIFCGRIAENPQNSNNSLSITLDQLNKILTKSDFEKYVVEKPTASFYNFISLKQAFENIYNAPHNEIDEQSYHFAPFVLDESTYLPDSTQGITFKDDNLGDNFQIYAEDYVAATDRKIHCQFYYFNNSPNCGIKFTEYNEQNEIITNTDFSDTITSNWNVWGNTQSVLNWYEFDQTTFDDYDYNVILNYSRYFRPFKVVLAGINETNANAGGNYRTKRNYIFPYGKIPFSDIREDFSPRDNTLYDPRVKNPIYEQVKILPGDSHICEQGDVLVYFEVLGDVRYNAFNGCPSANILYDNYSIVYVYNLTKDIVYFDHITNFAQSTPLPSQWVDSSNGIKSFINADKIYFASRLNYDSENNLRLHFLSHTKPMCAVYDPSASSGDGYGSRQLVASSSYALYGETFGSLQVNTDDNGLNGNTVGEKVMLPYSFGQLDLNSGTSGLTQAKTLMDFIQSSNYPKSIRISEDGSDIIFIKGVTSQFFRWDSTWVPEKVNADDYTLTRQFPRYVRYCSKKLYMTRSNGTTSTNQNEYDIKKYINFANLSTPLFNEIGTELSNNSMVLACANIYIYLNSAANGNTYVLKATTDYSTASDKITVGTDIAIKTVGFYYSIIETNFVWFLKNDLYLGMQKLDTLQNDYTILDVYGNSYYMIIQTPTQILYYKYSTDEILYSRDIIGFEYLLPTDRDSFIFINPIVGKSNEIYIVTNVINEPVRLLSFSGNRYKAGARLAASFFKNTYTDGNGVLNIGNDTTDKIFLDDNDIISISVKSYKYDNAEYTPMVLQKNGFTQTDNDDATTKEEDNNFYDESISVSMWSNKDVQLNFTVSRVATNQLKWTATNEFYTKTETITETGFNFFSVDLTGDFAGITIYCDFYNTELAQGEKFRGVIERREYKKDIVSEPILTVANNDESFPTIDEKSISFNFPFVNSVNKTSFTAALSEYIISQNKIREVFETTITIPCLLLFDQNYYAFETNKIISISSEEKYVNGWKLNSDASIERYNINRCDYRIEQMRYNKQQGTTTLSLVSV